MKQFSIFALFLTLLFTTACNSNESQQSDRVETKDIFQRDAAIETLVSTEPLGDAAVLLITTHKIWNQNVLVKEIREVDTIPNVSTPTEKKDYEFYITVK